MTKKPGLSKIEQKRLGLRLGRIDSELSDYMVEIANAYASGSLPSQVVKNLVKAQRYLRDGRGMLENLYFKEFPGETLRSYKDTTGIPQTEEDPGPVKEP